MSTPFSFRALARIALAIGIGWLAASATTAPAPAAPPPSTVSARTGPDPSAVAIRIACGTVGRELELCREAAERWAAANGHAVQVVALPSDSNERLAQLRQMLDAGSDKIDVFQVDVVWPGLLAPHLVDLRPYAKGAEAAMFPGFVGNDTQGGRLVAMPWFVNGSLLFYRKDLLAKHGARVPATWAELTATARRIQDAERRSGNEKMWGFVWQGRAYEGLTCDALEWISSSGGGSLIEADGRVTVNNPRAAAALRLAASWVGSISPQSVLNFSEEESRGVFQAGNAVFMRNWPYAWAMARAPQSVVREQVGIAPLPRGEGGASTSTLGGESLAVSRYSRHPELAASLVMYMTSAAVQRQRAIVASYNPSIASLYVDPDIVSVNPYMPAFHDIALHAVARPTSVAGARYGDVSSDFWTAVHGVLAGQVDTDQALQDLEAKLTRAMRGE